MTSLEQRSSTQSKSGPSIRRQSLKGEKPALSRCAVMCKRSIGHIGACLEVIESHPQNLMWVAKIVWYVRGK
jgi:hypothetical protein